MASNGTNGNGSQLLVVGDTGGVTLIDPSTPLKRLNYFDGKFLRASDFDVEQSYLRQLVALSNQGLGAGVVYGYDTTLGGGDTIQVGPGLAIDPAGKVLLMQGTVTQSIQALIDASKKVAPAAPDASGKTGAGTFNDCIEVAAPPPTTVVATGDLYVIAICPAEALCGQADVYGKLCEDACVTSTDRPYRLDGIVLRAIPLQLVTPFPTSNAVAIDSDLYLRSKVAHSWYADEVLKHPSAISRAGLLTTVWCLGAGYDSSCCEVPLAVIARSGSTTVFLDAWTVRRERIDAPARRYWQWKMMMRPWNVFLAQILQFQCQLAELFEGILIPGRTPDPCANERQALGEAASLISELRSGLASYRSMPTTLAVSDQPAVLALSLTRITDLHDKLASLLTAGAGLSLAQNRILIRGGIIELPPAGYLPVSNTTSVSVNDQVRALLGEGLDLRFCIASADYIAHEVEKAQHMDRISLLQGIDDPSNKPKVDIIVPEGKIASGTTSPDAGLYDALLTYSAEQTGGLAYAGAAREEALDSGGTALYVAGAGVSQSAASKFANIASALGRRTKTPTSLTITPNLAANQFVSSSAANTVNLAARAASTAMLARSFLSRASMVTTPSEATNITVGARESADGFWLTARSEKQLKTLAAGTQTPVGARLIVGSHPAAPIAYEMLFNGRLAVDTVTAAGDTLTGTLNGLVTVGAFKADQAKEQETEILFISHVNLNVTLKYTGDDQNGSISMTVGTAGATLAYVVTKTYAGTAHLTYTIAISSTPAGTAAPTVVQLAKLDLLTDSGVVDSANQNHVLAQNGLDIVQASLIESEPNFEKQAAAELFPDLPPATSELIIQAVRDWVMFTKRREEHCALDVVPTPQAPPRSYQVINIPAKNADDAQRYIEDLNANLQDPATLGNWLSALIAVANRRGRLVVRFAGNSAAALSDLGAAESDWKQLNPGDAIYMAAAGANGETNGALQLSRIRTFEGAIAGDSKESATAKEIAILPYPTTAIPAGADGVMLFVTASTVEAVHVFGGASADIWTLLQNAVAQGGVAGILGRFADLGIASAKGSGAAQTVTDSDVVTAFNGKFPNTTIGDAMVISRAGDATDAYNNRVAAGVKVVSDIDSNAAAPSRSTYPAAGQTGVAFPVADANAMLFVRVVRTVAATRASRRGT
jgi:hypothetical protein